MYQQLSSNKPNQAILLKLTSRSQFYSNSTCNSMAVDGNIKPIDINMTINAKATSSFWPRQGRCDLSGASDQMLDEDNTDFNMNGIEVPLDDDVSPLIGRIVSELSCHSHVSDYSFHEYQLFGHKKFQFANYGNGNSDSGIDGDSPRHSFSDQSGFGTYSDFGSIGDRLSRSPSFQSLIFDPDSVNSISPFSSPIHQPNNRIENTRTGRPIYSNKRRNRRQAKAKNQNGCNFCKTNGESIEQYSSHVLKLPNGKVACPVLRAYNCKICNNGGGDDAHTDKYCPLNIDGHVQSGVMNMLKKARASNGKQKSLHGHRKNNPN